MPGIGGRTFVSMVAVAAAGVLLLVGAGVGAPPAAASFATQCGAPTRVLDPASPSVALASGETVLLATGTFTGGVNALPSGATLCVAAGAVLQPAYVNNASGSVVIAAGGNAAFPAVAVGTGFDLDVEGVAAFSGLNVNGASSFTIAAGGTLTVAGGFSPSAGTFDNAGTMVVEGTLNLNSGAHIENAGELRIEGDANLNGRMDNTGTVEVTGSVTLNGGRFANLCRVRTAGALSNNSGESTNAGIVIAGGVFANNGTWRQSVEGLLSSAGLTDDGTVTGFGAYRFDGFTSVQGRFTGDSPGNPIQVHTQAPPGSIFDVQTGVVANVIRVADTRAATLDAPLPGCSANAEPFADVSVSKSGPATVLPGGDVTYTLVVANAGPDDATGVLLVDALPPETTAVVDAGGGTVTAGTISWSVGTLAPGTSASRTFTISQTAAVDTVLRDAASAVSDTADPDPSNNDGTSLDSQAETTVVAVAPSANNPPVAEPLVQPGFTDQLLFGRVTASDPDAGQELSFRITTPPAHGRAALVAGGYFGYRSASDFTGDDSFVYEVCDDGAPVLCASATVFLPISPVAVDDEAQTFADAAVEVPVVANDSDGAALDATLVSAPANGTGVVDPAASSITYTPAAGFTGQDSFQYRICSPTNASLCSTATVTVTVRPVNHPPVVEPLQLTTTVQTPVSLRIRATDPDPGQQLIYSRGIPPRSGTATVVGDEATYSPRFDFAGADSFTVIVCDDGEVVLCGTAIADVDVYPVANPDTSSTPQGTAVTIPVTDNDLGDVGPPTVSTNPAHGTATVSGMSIVYTPEPGYSGSDTFEYTICASIGPTLCATATVTVEVQPAAVVPPDGSGGSGSGAVELPPSPGGLAITGSSAPSLWAIGAAAIAIVLGVSMVLRRRRAAEARSF